MTSIKYSAQYFAWKLDVRIQMMKMFSEFMN